MNQMLTHPRIMTLVGLVLIMVLTRFTVAGWDRIIRNANSADGDQSAYLQLGLDVREHAHLTDGKRNPLYPVLIAPLAHRGWAYFTWAKLLNLTLGAVTVISLYFIGTWLFNRWAGLLAAALLSINMEFIMHSSFALAESSLILMVLWAWFMMVRALQEPDASRYWLAAGVLTGLAYLAKGTGPLFAACFLLTATLLMGPWLWIRRPVWSYIGAFGVTALPLWLFNWWTFGSPLFNAAITNVMWMDDATQKYVADPADMPTIATYLAANSFGDMWARLSEGLLAMRYFYVRLLWPTRTLQLDEFYQAGYFDLVLVGLVILAVIFWRPLKTVAINYKASLLLTGVLVGVFYVLFGWYLAIAPFPIRFLLPLAPMLYLLIAAGVIGLGQVIFTQPQLPRWVKVGVGAALTLTVAYPVLWFGITGVLIGQGAWQNPFTVDATYNDSLDQPLLWTRTGHTEPGTVSVMWGPTHRLPTWKHSDFLNLPRTPAADAESLPALNRFLAESNITYIIMDTEMLDRVDRSVTDALGVAQLDNGRIAFTQFPPDWVLGYATPGLPCEWCVFRRLSAHPPPTPVDYHLGDTIRLFAYELESSRFYPGGQLTVMLYWEALGPSPADYTVFTQLLGPDHHLHGQMDRQPLSGTWPTSQWQAGQRFVDKFVLDLNPAAPGGDYTLLVGLYDLQTGVRVPARYQHTPLADHAIPLQQLHMSLHIP